MILKLQTLVYSAPNGSALYLSSLLLCGGWPGTRWALRGPRQLSWQPLTLKHIARRVYPICSVAKVSSYVPIWLYLRPVETSKNAPGYLQTAFEGNIIHDDSLQVHAYMAVIETIDNFLNTPGCIQKAFKKYQTLTLANCEIWLQGFFHQSWPLVWDRLLKHAQKWILFQNMRMQQKSPASAL